MGRDLFAGKDYVSASTTDEDGKQLLHEPLLVNCTEDGGVTERMSCGSHQSGYRQNYSVEHRRLSSSLVSVDGGVCEAPGTRPSNKPLLDGDIPWWPMLSHKVVWTLFVQGWVFVSTTMHCCTGFCCCHLIISIDCAIPVFIVV